jgi:hypothetical protein
LKNPASNLSRPSSQPKAPYEIKQQEPNSQLQPNWMSSPHDPFKDTNETDESQSSTQHTQTDWMQQQDSGWHAIELQDYDGQALEEVWSEDSTITS